MGNSISEEPTWVGEVYVKSSYEDKGEVTYGINISNKGRNKVRNVRMLIITPDNQESVVELKSRFLEQGYQGVITIRSVKSYQHDFIDRSKFFILWNEKGEEHRELFMEGPGERATA